MRDAGLDVVIITPLGRGGRGGIDRIMDNVADFLATIPSPALRIRFLVTRGQGHIGLSPFVLAATIFRLAFAKFSGNAPDIVHINLSHRGSTVRKLIIAAALRGLRLPYAVHLHGSNYDEYWERTPVWLSRQIDRMFVDAAAVIVLGKRWYDYVARRLPECAERIYKLPNATPDYGMLGDGIDGQPKNRASLKILFLGEVGDRKGVPQLLEALAQLKKLDGWHAEIAGNGEIARFQREIERLGLTERVHLSGWLGPDAVAATLSRADLLVLPSFSENLPMSVIEGMAAGLAVVTTPVGATPDIIEDDVTGLLVPPGNAPALASALRRVIEDPGLRTRLGAAARTFHRENLTMSVYVPRLIAIWKAAILNR